MAPRTEFSIEQVRNKARKDLLYLIEGVSKAPSSSLRCEIRRASGHQAADCVSLSTGSWQEERCP
jgi:hypothetical protein